jgi:hypothetical protein
MKRTSFQSTMRGLTFLFFLVFSLGCRKEKDMKPSQSNPSSSLNTNGNGSNAATLALSQTRTATRLNYNFKGNLQNSYPKATATDIQADDDAYATSSRFSPRHGGPTLVLQGFGFDIPTGATIDNIIIKVRRLKVGNGTVSEYFVSLVRNRNRAPEWWEEYGFYWTDPINTSPTNLIPAIETEITYAQPGSGNDGSGGNQPYQWTPAMINDPLFGMETHVGAVQGGAELVKYDYAEIRVEYSL